MSSSVAFFSTLLPAEFALGPALLSLLQVLAVLWFARLLRPRQQGGINDKKRPQKPCFDHQQPGPTEEATSAAVGEEEDWPKQAQQQPDVPASCAQQRRQQQRLAERRLPRHRMLVFSPSAGFLRPRRKMMSEPELAAGGRAATSAGGGGGGGHSLADLQQIPDELWHTRRRIEAGVQNQRRQREILAEVQQRLASVRLDRAQQPPWLESSPRARSHSPPSSGSWQMPEAIVPERPSTSHLGRPALDGLTMQMPFGAAQQPPAQSQFRVRLSLLEQQMDRLNHLAGQTLAKMAGDSLAMADREHTRRKANELGAELARMRRRLWQLRDWAQEEMATTGQELDQALKSLARRLKRDLAMSRRCREQTLWAELERRKGREAKLCVQVQKLTSSHSESERRVKLMEMAFHQIWALPALAHSAKAHQPKADASSIDDQSAGQLAAAIQSAVERVEFTERSRWEEQLELWKERGREELEEQRRRHAEEMSRERRESTQKAEQREQQWMVERQKLCQENARVKAELADALSRVEAADLERQRNGEESEKSRRRLDAELAEEKAARGRLEAEMLAEKAKIGSETGIRRSLEERLARAEQQSAESREAAEAAERRARELEEQMQKSERGRQKAEQRLLEQQTTIGALNEELRVNSARLGRAESQLETFLAQSQQLAHTRLDNGKLAEKLAEADTELEALREKLAGTEQRLRTERGLRMAEAETADRQWEQQGEMLAQMESQKAELARALAEAERRLAEVERTESARAGLEQRLRAELARAEAEANEQQLVEELAEDRQRRMGRELDRLRAELAEKEAELAEAQERGDELTDRMATAEQRLAKAGELCRKLNAELDELSERSLTQNCSAEKLKADLEEASGELALLKQSLEEQRRRNSLLEAELRQADSARLQELQNERQRMETEFSGRLRVEVERWSAELAKREVEWTALVGKQKPRQAEESQLETLLAKWTLRTGLTAEDGGAESLTRLEMLLEAIWSQLERMERQLRECQKEGESLGAQLASGRQMLVTQQSELSAREAECQKLRQKLGRAEMAKSEREVRAREEREMAEEGWRQQRQTLERRTDELEQSLARDRAEGLKQQHRKVEAGMASDSEQQLREQIKKLEADLAEMSLHLEELRARKQQRGKGGELSVEMASELARERERLRMELAEVQRKLALALQRNSQMQGRLDKAREERESSERRAELAEKRESETKRLEATLRSELHEVRLQWRKCVQELEALRRQLRELEATRKELEAQLGRCQREASAQRQHIEALELERRRVEALIRQTTLERNSLDSSLGALERENSELQKHCLSLQTQVERLAREGEQQTLQGHRRRVAQLEAELAKAGQERRRLEKVLEQRESGRDTRIGLLESRLEQARAELEAERRCRKQSSSRATTSAAAVGFGGHGK